MANTTKVKVLNTIILTDSSSHAQKMQAIELLRAIDPEQCVKTVELSYIAQSAKNGNSDNINKALRN